MSAEVYNDFLGCMVSFGFDHVLVTGARRIDACFDIYAGDTGTAPWEVKGLRQATYSSKELYELTSWSRRQHRSGCWSARPYFSSLDLKLGLGFWSGQHVLSGMSIGLPKNDSKEAQGAFRGLSKKV